MIAIQAGDRGAEMGSRLDLLMSKFIQTKRLFKKHINIDLNEIG